MGQFNDGPRAFRPSTRTRPGALIDQQHCGTPPGVTGPVEQQLQAFGQLRGLVFGASGEASPDVELLLAHAASAGAHRHWRSMGCGDDGSPRGILAWMLRLRWGNYWTRTACPPQTV